MGEFQKQRTYSGQFNDIKGKWCETYVADLYEYGLAQGMDESTMAPDEPVTVAQVIALASRINAKYYDGHIDQPGNGRWYEPYISYARDYGLIDRESVVDAERPATRGESALIFSRALPDWQFDAVNGYSGFGDVAGDSEYSQAVALLCRAGVINGYDDGLFYPDAGISRAEAMTIADKTVNKGQRRGYNESFSGAGDSGNGTEDNKWYANSASGTFMLSNVAMINVDVEKGNFMMAVSASWNGGMVTVAGVCETKADFNGNITVSCVVTDRVVQDSTSIYVAKQAEDLDAMVFAYDGSRSLTFSEAVVDGKVVSFSNSERNNPVIGLLSIGMTLSLAN